MPKSQYASSAFSGSSSRHTPSAVSTCSRGGSSSLALSNGGDGRSLASLFPDGYTEVVEKDDETGDPTCRIVTLVPKNAPSETEMDGVSIAGPSSAAASYFPSSRRSSTSEARV